MENTNMYDVVKTQSKKYIKEYKNRRKVINKRISEFDDKYLLATAILMLIAGVSTIGLSSMTNDYLPFHSFSRIAGATMIALAPFMFFNGKDKTHKEEIEELKSKKEELNRLIKEEKERTNSKKAELKKVFVAHR